ncbi:FadR/GntR family transcriptional regulator [Mycobacterium sp. NAZ190054]|uniref:FadR/GntR family transcriptional regulator n=1 Tax=Mycobacterium sp. NAZ190054 TaxID=1747766 RepID=UPI000792B817|nr:FadR/GntR family transcriptional regulator [Mycobacterium sp. NAZ190054]KWX67462.1 GntR family transcriptional regulator [Mycobacterium sp. NAZ190054]
MRAHELVLQRIERDLAEGSLGVGDRLPAERTLAENLCVSRSSVREAMRVLEAMGVVRTATGSGPDAGAVVVADPITSIGSALRLHAATKHLPVADLVETRVLLESWAVDEAARRRGQGDLSGVEELLLAMDGDDLTPEEFHQLDAAFHVAVSTLSGNVVVAAMMAALRDSIHGYVMAGVPLLDDWAAVADGLREEHRAIVAAVRRGHGTKAAELMRHHIRGYFARMQRG